MSNFYLSALSVLHSIIYKNAKHKQILYARNQIKTQKTKTKTNRSQEAIRTSIGHPVDSSGCDGDKAKNDDDNLNDDSMEIVVVSDTVRQRRSRTPLPLTPTQSSTTTTTASELSDAPDGTKPKPKLKPKPLTMPDLLPKTFHLAESSALFSQVDNDAQILLAQKSPSLTPTQTPPAPPERRSSLRRMAENDYENVQKVSVVEIRESNLTTPKRAINTYHTQESLQRQNLGQMLNTCSILESVDYIEPCSVETVHIVDVTSEPSDSETPSSTPKQMKRTGRSNQRKSSSDSDDEDDDNESDTNEYETGEPPIVVSLPENVSTDKMRILRRQISWDESRRALKKDRDLLKDSEIKVIPESTSDKPHRKIIAGLKEILNARSGADSFDREPDSFDEPLVFSEDDDDDDGDDEVDEPQINRDTVFFIALKSPPKTESKCSIFLSIYNCIFCENE